MLYFALKNALNVIFELRILKKINKTFWFVFLFFFFYQRTKKYIAKSKTISGNRGFYHDYSIKSKPTIVVFSSLFSWKHIFN